MRPPTIPQTRVRVATEIVAALVSPVQAALTVFLPLLPVTAVVVADLERARARACGVDTDPYHLSAGSWRRWIGIRIRTSGVWRHDVPVSLVSALLGAVALVICTLGFVGGVVLLLAPAFRMVAGVDVSVGPWTAADPVVAWLMVPAGVALLILTLWLLVVVSLSRDVTLRLLSEDEEKRLQAELSTVRTSRASILEAFEAERRRIERDLHDGAQQDLLALSITLGMLDHQAGGITGPDGDRLRELTRRAHEQAERSLIRLRETVHGIHPRELTDHGLFAALGELVARAPLEVSCRCAGDDADLPSPVAGAMYFVVAESLTNIAVHADVGRGWVHADVRNGVAGVTIGDEGRGGAVVDESGGSTGLAGLRERIRGLGGELVVDSELGVGTTVTATAPVSFS